MKSTLLLGLSLCLLAGAAVPAAAAEPTYWQDVRPLLRKNCTFCHNPKHLDEPEVSGGLALDSLEAIRKGGPKGPVLQPGKGAGSQLVTILRHSDPRRRMPLDADPLPDETVALLRRWIDAGAPEGKKPADDSAVAIVQPATRTRKLDVVFTTKTPLPRNVAKPNQTGPLEVVLPVGPLAPVAAVAFSPDGKTLASGTYGRVVIWDAAAGRPVKVLTNVLGAVNDLRFSPDGKTLAVAGGQPSARGDLRLYSVGDWKLLASLGGHTDTIASISFSPDGKRLASASFDKTVRIWDLEARKSVLTYTGHSDFVHAVAFGPKGEWFVSASKDRSVRLVDAKTGQSRLTFSGMDQDVLAVAARPDGQQVVSSGFESQLFWWNAQTGERVRRQAGHDVAVHELAFSPDGSFAVSAGADKTVRVWDAKNGASLRVLPVGSMVYSVAVRADGKQVAAGSFDGAVRVWDAATGRLLLTLLAVPGEGPAGDWLALTPEAYVAGSDPLLAKAGWRASGRAVPAEMWRPELVKPESVAKALRGEKLDDPRFAAPARKP